MIVPDQSHINRIRDALWQFPQGCASVMVGAGFSRNARKAGPDAREFPLWHHVAASLCNKLYSPVDGQRLKHAIAEASGTSGFLRLAQEYQAAFGRGALHQFIQELVPDEDYVPDDMHIRLLRLPWRDVFTTNWDTLLERTRSLVADRAYGIVRTCEEIPSASRPRIIKLHGSFPAHIPFIFTEEDYRIYPKRFAPFVNTVQQAMMETVFCLIGFSGDDPNFLHWSGWVRDNLGELAPKIYLAGWLDLSPHRRRMLEERNVVPIDVARHPQASSWPDHLRHAYATEWILQTLERGRPYELTDWPSPPDSARNPIPEHLQPLEDVAINAPVVEPDFGSNEAGGTDLPRKVAHVIAAWEHNRKAYPGWLIIPPNKHSLFDRSRLEWERAILQVLPDILPLERLASLRELVWRREALLEPLSEDVEAKVQAVLNDVDCQSKKICGIEDNNARWVEVREAWRELALGLLTAARQRSDHNAFSTQIAALRPYTGDHPDVLQRVHHEKCLWALNALDFAALDPLLKEWGAERCDPIWMSRKAAILAEIDREDEAIQLLNRSLSIVRETPRHGPSMASPSREGWSLWLALAFEGGFSRAVTKVIDAPPAFRRWGQLSVLQCDAFAQKQEFMAALRDETTNKKVPLFDLGTRRGRRITFSNSKYRLWIGSRRAIRLTEVAALPPSASHMVVATDLLALAAENLADSDLALSLRLVLRLANSEDDSTFEVVWARTRIAAIPIEDVDTLVTMVLNVINHFLPKATSVRPSSTGWVTRLRISMEALSRLVLRLPPERAEEILKHALSYYRIDVIAKHRWLRKPVQHLMSRAWEALPRTHREALVFDLLSAPIAGLDGFGPLDEYYPDPVDLIADIERTTPPPRSAETEGLWSQIVQLITRGLRTGGEARRRSSLRLVPVNVWGRLTDNERKTVAEALWSGDLGPATLPAGTSLHDWSFLVLPEPESGQAEQRFRRKWFGTEEPETEKELSLYLWVVGTSLEGLRQYRRPLALTEEETAKISRILGKWIAVPQPWDQDSASEGVRGLQCILPEITLAAPVAESLFARALAFNQADIPSFRLFPGLARFLPEKLDEMATLMRIGLASDNVAIAEDALLALHVWMRNASEEAAGIPAPPVDLLRELSLMIATRRKGVLNFALQISRWIFTSGSPDQKNAIAQSVLHGLGYLIEELRYDRPHRKEKQPEIPVLRWGCAHVALAMSAVGYNEDPTVIRWAEVASQDPLPEVRYAEVPASVRPDDGRYVCD